MDQRGVRRPSARQREARARLLEAQRATASSAIAPPTTTSQTRSPRNRTVLSTEIIRPMTNSPRRATALHPYLDGYPKWYSDGPLSSGFDSGYEQGNESGEEEERERDEVEGRERIGAYINPPVIVARDLPVEEVRRLPRPNVVDPRQPLDHIAEQDDYSLGSDQEDPVVEDLARSSAAARARRFQPQRRDYPPHPPLTVHGHVVIDNQGRVNAEGLHRVVLYDRARMDRLGIPRGSAAKSKAMPAIAKPMPRQPTSDAASSHEALQEPDVDQVLEMENEDVVVPDDNQKDHDDNDDAYHLGMLEGDESWSEKWSSVMGDLGRVGNSGTALPGGSLPKSLNPKQRPVQGYHLGMLEEDELWSAEWSSAKGDLGRVCDSGTALPGGSPPELLSPGQKPVQAKDAVHEVEWDGQTVHHSSSRSGTYNVSKLASTWKIAGTAPVYVDGQSDDGVFTMSYTLDKDPKSTGLTWWGTTYVKIKGRKAPSANANMPIIPSGTAYALVDSGASHVLMPLNSRFLKERTHAKDISVNLA
eukprot:6113286-Amphidinium_carterae.1